MNKCTLFVNCKQIVKQLSFHTLYLTDPIGQFYWHVYCGQIPLRENFVTYQATVATYTLAGPPEMRWGNLKGMSAWE